MTTAQQGYNTAGLPILADGALTGNMTVAADTQAAGGAAPQEIALTLNQMSAGAFGVVAAAGATQGGATALPLLAQNVMVTVTASTEGVILPAPTTGKVRRIFVPGTVGVKVYPPAHCFLDTGASNVAIVLAAGKGNIYIATDTTHWKTMVKGA
jgi:hypothetical protein